MKKPMTVQEFASKGGKSRWKGIPKKERSKAMKAVRAKSITTQKGLDELAR